MNNEIGMLSANIGGDARYTDRLSVRYDNENNKVIVRVESTGAAGGMDGPGGTTEPRIEWADTVAPNPAQVVASIKRAMKSSNVLRGYGKLKNFVWTTSWKRGVNAANAKEALLSAGATLASAARKKTKNKGPMRMLTDKEFQERLDQMIAQQKARRKKSLNKSNESRSYSSRLVEGSLRKHIRNVLAESQYVTPGTRHAQLAEEMKLDEFHGILETVKQYANRYDTTAFNVLDEMMALTEDTGVDRRNAKGNVNLVEGDNLRLTWVNEDLSRDDVTVAKVGLCEVHLAVKGITGTSMFVKRKGQWFEQSNPNDPVVFERLCEG